MHITDVDGSYVMLFFSQIGCQTVLKNNNDSYVPKKKCPLIRACTLNRTNTVTRPIVSCPPAAAAGDVVIVSEFDRATIPWR